MAAQNSLNFYPELLLNPLNVLAFLNLEFFDHFLVHINLFVEGLGDSDDFGLELLNFLLVELVFSLVETALLPLLLDPLIRSNLSKNTILVELLRGIGHLHERAFCWRKRHSF